MEDYFLAKNKRRCGAGKGTEFLDDVVVEITKSRNAKREEKKTTNHAKAKQQWIEGLRLAFTANGKSQIRVYVSAK